MSKYLFTSESVGRGHPDKVADQISDAILDACLKGDPNSRVACETLVSRDLVVVAGEITTKTDVDYVAVVRDTIKDIGYVYPGIGFDAATCKVQCEIEPQSPDISQGVTEGEGKFQSQGAGDQGIMFGYATDEHESYLPLTLVLSHEIMKRCELAMKSGLLPWLLPDGKCQVTLEYEDGVPVKATSVVLSHQHDADVSMSTLHGDFIILIKCTFDDLGVAFLLDDNTQYLCNPTGRFHHGGPAADVGLTGRKIIVDTYGGAAPHGGGAFSGKDPSKVDRSAAYAARYIAKVLVKSGLCHRCEVQLAYAIGYPNPVGVYVDTYHTNDLYSDEVISYVAKELIDLTPKGINDLFDLKNVSYYPTAFYGHFQEGFNWETVSDVHLGKVQSLVLLAAKSISEKA